MLKVSVPLGVHILSVPEPTIDELSEKILKQGYIETDGGCWLGDDFIKGGKDPATISPKKKVK